MCTSPSSVIPRYIIALLTKKLYMFYNHMVHMFTVLHTYTIVHYSTIHIYVCIFLLYQSIDVHRLKPVFTP